MYRINSIFNAVICTASILLLSGCGLFEKEVDCYPDFGSEGGFESVTIVNDTVRFYPMWRDRNHLYIRFYNWVGKEKADSILAAEGLINRFPQDFGTAGVGNFVRVTQKPAEYYYTTYGDTSLPRLGNRKEVEFALPAEFREKKTAQRLGWAPNPRTTKFTVVFKNDIPLIDQIKWIDSVLVADQIQEQPLLFGERPPGFFGLKISKTSKSDSYTLSNRYMTHKFIKFAEPSRAIYPNGLTPLECENY